MTDHVGGHPAIGDSSLEHKPPAATKPLTKSLSNVEATTTKTCFYRTRAVSLLLRPDGQPYFDNSYDDALVNAVLSSEQQYELATSEAGTPQMLPFMVLRTAEVDHQILDAVWGPAGPDAGADAEAAAKTHASADADPLLRRPGPGAEKPHPGGTVGAAGGSEAATRQRTAVRQVVLLGAGLDPRAWRLPLPIRNHGSAAVQQLLPSTTEEVEAALAAAGGPAEEKVVMFELDSGAVEELKVQVLGRPTRCRRVFLPVNLEAPELALPALAAAGHDPGRPTVFVAEGLIGYLTREGGNALLAGLRSRAAPGSRLALTPPPSAAWRDELQRQGMKLYHLTYEDTDVTLQRVIDAGWDAQLLTAAELGDKYRVSGNRFELIVGRC